jgi:hypothetical protein
MNQKKLSVILIIVGVFIVIISWPLLMMITSFVNVNQDINVLIASLFALAFSSIGYWMIIFGMLNTTKLKLSYKILISLVLAPGIKLVGYVLTGWLNVTANFIAIFIALIIMIVQNNKKEITSDSLLTQMPEENKVKTVSLLFFSGGISVLISTASIYLGALLLWLFMSKSGGSSGLGDIGYLILLVIFGFIIFVVSFALSSIYIMKKGIKNRIVMFFGRAVGILIFIFIFMIVGRVVFFDFENVPRIRTNLWCFLSTDRNQCRFNLAIKQSLKYNSLKYCENLYSKYKLDPNYLPFPHNTIGSYPGGSLYPNRCMEFFHQWFYINERNKMFDLGFQEEIKVGQEACKNIAKVDGYNEKYPYNVKGCLDELRDSIYRQIVYYSMGVCEDLKKIEGWEDGKYSFENCLNEVELSNQLTIEELTDQEMAGWYECIRPFQDAQFKEMDELCSIQDTSPVSESCNLSVEAYEIYKNIQDKYQDLIEKECPMEELVKSEFIRCRIAAINLAGEKTVWRNNEQEYQEVQNELQIDFEKCEQLR